MSKTSDPKLLRHEEARHALARLVMRMGFSWNDHHVEYGIDAFVELADPSTHKALGAFVGVQVKTVQHFDAESDTEFSYYVSEADLNYWLASRMPVLLVVGRPSDDRFYGVHVQAYFTAQRPGTRTVRFNKATDQFNSSEIWQRRLLDVGKGFTRGLAFSPQTEPETIVSNLLHVTLPDIVYTSPTKFRVGKEVAAKLKGTPAGYFTEYILKDEQLWSPVNLADPVLCSALGEEVTVRRMPFDELAFNEDRAKRRYAVELLEYCLSARLRRLSVFWSKDAEMYFFRPKHSPTDRMTIEVATETGPSTQGIAFPAFRDGKIVRCRHVALVADFVSIGDQYYLQLNPTCLFTKDGSELHPRHEELLQNLKIMQKQHDYHRSLFLWRTLLTRPGDLVEPEYPHLSFGDFLRVKSPVSIADDAWRKAGGAAHAIGENEFDALLT
ncbi:MAG: DUF4365 domain-containing protein [Opitutaceae bacterium]|nr:DUF4365 domain-containing protein [Opitutaceae bacterium]